MYDAFLFAGTTEGRRLADGFRNLGKKILVLTATEYGQSLVPEGDGIETRSSRLDQEQMVRLFREEGKREARILDATHPYAAIVTENLLAAAKETGLSYIRVLRKASGEAEEEETLAGLPDSGVVYVKSTGEAAAYLAKTEGNVLLTTGSKELPLFTAVPDFRNRLFARILSLPSQVSASYDLGYTGRHLICMQGPFSEEMNIALIRQTEASILVTKDTGKEGGFPEKISAARKCGCRLVIIGRPLPDEEGISVEECIEEMRTLWEKSH